MDTGLTCAAPRSVPAGMGRAKLSVTMMVLPSSLPLGGEEMVGQEAGQLCVDHFGCG